MNKEIILIVAVIASLALYYFTFSMMNKLKLNRATKIAYTYLTLLVPILGFIIVSRRAQSDKG